MNSNLRSILFVINLLALLASFIWFIVNPDFEPAISILVLIATLIGLWVDFRKKKTLKQKQTGGKNSINIQAGRDIKL